MKKDGYTLNLVHLSVRTGNLKLVKYLLDTLKMKLAMSLPQFKGNEETEGENGVIDLPSIMVKVLESIDVEILDYLLDKFCPLFEWDIVTYFISLTANLSD